MAQVVTNVGKGWIGGFLAQATAAGSGLGSLAATFVAWGTGTTTAAVTQTTLVTPSAEARTNGTRTAVTTTNASDTYQVVGTITSASAQAITEVGLFDASTTGNMVVRADFAAINVANGDSVQFTIKIQFT